MSSITQESLELLKRALAAPDDYARQVDFDRDRSRRL